MYCIILYLFVFECCFCCGLVFAIFSDGWLYCMAMVCGVTDNDDDDDAVNNDDHNYSNSDIVCNNMNCDKGKGEGVEEGDGDDDRADDEMMDGTENNKVVSRKRKRRIY